MAEANRGDIAFHLVMALCADMAVHDDERLGRILYTLGEMLDGEAPANDEQYDAPRAAYDLLLRLGGTPTPT